MWVVGCATGEETYSLAILFKEYMEEIKENYNIKIFATDIEKQALQIAGEGIYSEGVVADLSPERLNRYFTKKGSKYQIIDSIRKMIIFAPHNIITDPPFLENRFDQLPEFVNLFKHRNSKTGIKSISFCLNPSRYSVFRI